MAGYRTNLLQRRSRHKALAEPEGCSALIRPAGQTKKYCN